MAPGPDGPSRPPANAPPGQLGRLLPAAALAVALGATLGAGACATARHADASALQPTVEALHTALRWRDFGTASELVVHERRAAFLRARERSHDERDLAFSELASDSATIDPVAGTATVRSRMSWVRLPSPSERSELVEAQYVWRGGRWWLERLEGGPFPELDPGDGAPHGRAWSGEAERAPAIQTPTDSGPAEAVGGGGPPMGLPH